MIFFFFQAEDGIRDLTVTGVQTCALPIYVAELGKVAFQAGVGHGVGQIALVDFGGHRKTSSIGCAQKGAPLACMRRTVQSAAVNGWEGGRRAVSTQAGAACRAGASPGGRQTRSEERRVGERGRYRGGPG